MVGKTVGSSAVMLAMLLVAVRVAHLEVQMVAK
jgi:hypothetical protein